MSSHSQGARDARRSPAADRRPLPQLSDRERRFWRHAVAVERQRLEFAVCAPPVQSGTNLH